MKKRFFALLLAAMIVLLAGCSSDKKEEANPVSLHVVVAATYVTDEMVEGLKTELAKLTDYPNISVTTVLLGDPDADPMSTVAGMAKLTGMMASDEVELLLTDADNARRHGDGGETYTKLADMFTEEQIAAFTGTPAGIPILDDEGNATGETSAPCGVVLSANASGLTGLADMQMHVLSNSKNMDAAKAAFSMLASVE